MAVRHRPRRPVYGTIALAPVGKGWRSASVHAWYVPEPHREKGIGNALLTGAEAHALHLGVHTLWITTYYWNIPLARGYTYHTQMQDGAKLLLVLDPLTPSA